MPPNSTAAHRIVHDLMGSLFWISSSLNDQKTQIKNKKIDKTSDIINAKRITVFAVFWSCWIGHALVWLLCSKNDFISLSILPSKPCITQNPLVPWKKPTIAANENINVNRNNTNLLISKKRCITISKKNMPKPDRNRKSLPFILILGTILN